MTALEIEIAVMKYFNPRQNIIVPNVSWGLYNKEYKSLHECDLIVLSGANWATEVEIKISKSDLLKDAEKPHGHNHNLIRRLYFAVPESLMDIAMQNIPERSGLIVIKQKTRIKYKKDKYGGYLKDGDMQYLIAEVVRESKINVSAVKWTDAQRYQLARLGTMRILGLKEKLCKA